MHWALPNFSDLLALPPPNIPPLLKLSLGFTNLLKVMLPREELRNVSSHIKYAC